VPGTDAIYLEDTQHLSKDDHNKLLSDCLDKFSAADKSRTPHDTRWSRYYRLYRSFVPAPTASWTSNDFMPITFYVIETILPKLVAQLPEFLVKPMGPEDADPAELMATVLGWAAENSGLFEQQTYAFKDALMYGTGILKTYHRHDTRPARVQDKRQLSLDVPMPVIDPDTGKPMMGPDGPVMGTQPYQLGEHFIGAKDETVTVYDGPAAESIDLFNFWVAPEASCIEDARYVIQRSFKELDWVKQMVKDKVYIFPEGVDPDEWGAIDDEPHKKRLADIGMDVSRDPTRRPVEVMEFWTNERCVTMLNRRTVVRAQKNPFLHGEKPYVRIVDHVVPHEFYGVGEIEIIEDLQDVYNALVNMRIDNVKVSINSMFAVNIDHVYDQRDLTTRPGGIVRVREVGMPVNQVFQRIDMGDVTSSSFIEAEKVLMMVERVTGVSAYQLGSDSASLNKTATGVNIITEQGNIRFSLKMRLAEMTGLRTLGRHFGSILQQFMPDEMSMRITGDAGQFSFASLTPDAILGSFDYDIEPQSMAVTESLMKDQSLSLFQMLSQAIDPATGKPYLNVEKLADDVLKAYGIKNRQAYLAPPPPPMPAAPPGMPPGMPPPGQMQGGPPPALPGGQTVPMGPDSLPPAGFPGAAQYTPPAAPVPNGRPL
jgi:hypothetical protein